MKTLLLNGACDLHIHSAPCIFDRIGDDVEMAVRAREAGMRAIVLKSHHEPTYSRAWHTSRQVPGIKVYGGVVLDQHVGGVNPSAVEPCIKVGGKIVWMPTYHALGHLERFGAIGTYGYMGGEFRTDYAPLVVMDDKGKLLPEAHIVMEMCKEADIILASGHLRPEEILLLAKTAKEKNFKKFVVNHPFFKAPSLDTQTVGELIKLGAYIEFCSGSMCPIPRSAKLSDYKTCIEQYGTSQMIIATDGGHNRKGWPADDMRVFAQQLMYTGVREEQIHEMLCDNYYYLLNLPPVEEAEIETTEENEVLSNV